MSEIYGRRVKEAVSFSEYLRVKPTWSRTCLTQESMWLDNVIQQRRGHGLLSQACPGAAVRIWMNSYIPQPCFGSHKRGENILCFI